MTEPAVAEAAGSVDGSTEHNRLLDIAPDCPVAKPALTMDEIAAGAADLALDLLPYFVGGSLDENIALARVLVGASDAHFKEIALAMGSPVACAARCPACCITPDSVGALPGEVDRILNLVEAQGRLEEVERRASLRLQRGKGACPLLSRNGQCSVYEERPLTCRTYATFDKQACRTGYRHPDHSIPTVADLIATRGALLAAILHQHPGEQASDLYEALAAKTSARLRQQKKRQRRAKA